LWWFYVHVRQAVASKIQFVGNGGSAKREMVTIADVYSSASEVIARGCAAHLGARLNQKSGESFARKVGSCDEAVMASTYDYGIKVA
jgi:hypothetical protein